jgi:hypothetical protein
LSPNRNHSDEKRDRRQRGSFFHECFQHTRLPPYENISGTLFPLCSESQGAIAGQFEK